MDIYSALRPLIYRLTPEQAHTITIAMLRLSGGNFLSRAILNSLFRPLHNGPAVNAFGLTFSNPLGMAAGYDKDGYGWRGLATLGFGHIELGTVTPRSQAGNPKPRVFRLVDDQAVINRMGFPGNGAQFLAERLKGNRPKGLVLGVNIGKNKDTALDQAVQDYIFLVRAFASRCDYLAVNVSSPNTPGLRTLQARKALEELLAPLDQERKAQSKLLGRAVPVLVKLAPDLSDDELDSSLEAILGTGMDGVIISNTTLQREGLTSVLKNETGGMSGAPLNALNTEMVKKTVTRLQRKIPVVASGGVMNRYDAQAKLDAGAVLVQLYTGLIYEGPALVKKILEEGLTLAG